MTITMPLNLPRHAAGVAACGLAVLAATPCLAGSYVYTTLAVPGATTTTAQSINHAGTVAGTYVSAADGKSRGFVYANGVYTSFSGRSTTRQVGNAAINDAGIVVAQEAAPKFNDANVFFHNRMGGQHVLAIPWRGLYLRLGGER